MLKGTSIFGDATTDYSSYSSYYQLLTPDRQHQGRHLTTLVLLGAGLSISRCFQVFQSYSAVDRLQEVSYEGMHGCLAEHSQTMSEQQLEEVQAIDAATRSVTVLQSGHPQHLGSGLELALGLG